MISCNKVVDGTCIGRIYTQLYVCHAAVSYVDGQGASNRLSLADCTF